MKIQLVYAAYTLFFILLLGSIVATPLLAFDHDVRILYQIYEPTCHQKISRSLCLFSDEDGKWIADCTPQEGRYVGDPSDSEQIRAEENGAIGYKMPVCSRDFGLYGGMLLGALVYPAVRGMDDRNVYPAIFLVIAMIPIGIDGGLQFISDLGVVPLAYESTNMLRLLTGAIAGIVASFYAIPLIMNFVKD